MIWRRGVLALAAVGLWPGSLAASDYLRLEGHGGPVRAVTVSGDTVLTASFDTSVGLWNLATGDSLAWLEGHDASVNAVAAAGDGRALSGGDDFAVILWDTGRGEAIERYEGHRGKVTALAVSPDGSLAASASWDGRIGLWPLRGGAEARFLDVGSPVNDVQFADGGRALYSASQDGTVRRWELAESGRQRVEYRNGFGVTRFVVDEEGGWMVYGDSSGRVRALDMRDYQQIADLTLSTAPILALARSSDGARVAVADSEGYVHVVWADRWVTERGFRAVYGGPVWALAFTGDAGQLVTGSVLEHVDVWPLDSLDALEGQSAAVPQWKQTDGEAMSNGELQYVRRCAVCHTLRGESVRRAGPTLYGVFGRRVGGLDSYSYSPALAQGEFLWDETTINQLFDLGPEVFVPGTKMPAQRIASDADRIDLIRFLRQATASANVEATP